MLMGGSPMQRGSRKRVGIVWQQSVSIKPRRHESRGGAHTRRRPDRSAQSLIKPPGDPSECARAIRAAQEPRPEPAPVSEPRENRYLRERLTRCELGFRHGGYCTGPLRWNRHGTIPSRLPRDKREGRAGRTLPVIGTDRVDFAQVPRTGDRGPERRNVRENFRIARQPPAIGSRRQGTSRKFYRSDPRDSVS
jgi:hypothetical protein